MSVKRIYVEKKPGFNIQAMKLMKEFKEDLGICNISRVRVLNRYDVENVSEKDFKKAKTTIFSEPPVDFIYDEDLPVKGNEKVKPLAIFLTSIRICISFLQMAVLIMMVAL
jgi:phosphoribosylformylglycinamidine synthase